VKSAVVLAALLAAASPVWAQSRFELGAAVTWSGGFDAGGVDALETRNPGTGSSPLTLFNTSSRQDAAVGAAATVAFFVTPRIAVEANVEYSRPVLRTTISNDFEGARGTEADSQLTSVVFGGSILYHFGGHRLVPFVMAGAGGLRQLDQDNVVLVTGGEVHAGAGVKYRLARHAGVRAEAGVSSRDKSLAFTDGRRTVPRTSVGLVVTF
jgi:hypothetical protein